MTKLSKSVASFSVLVVLALIVLSTSEGKSTRKLPTGSIRPSVAVGATHAVILASDGSLWTWGGNAFGWQVLGLGPTVRTQACLRRIGMDADWVNIAAGGSTTLALKCDGTLWAWGENLYGQLGDGTMVRDRVSPVQSVPGTDWKQSRHSRPSQRGSEKEWDLMVLGQ